MAQRRDAPGPAARQFRERVGPSGTRLPHQFRVGHYPSLPDRLGQRPERPI